MICTQIIKITKLIREGQPSHKLNTMEQLRFTPKNDDLFEKLAEHFKPIGAIMNDFVKDYEANKPKFTKDSFGNVTLQKGDFTAWISDKNDDKISIEFEIDTHLFDLDTTVEEYPNNPDTKEIEITLEEAVDNADEKDLINKAIHLIKIKL